MRSFSVELSSWARLGLRLTAKDGPCRSYLGGDPLLPPNHAWPSVDGRPMRFLARISLREADVCARLPQLPDEGALLFFYDGDSLPAGWDPNDKDRFAVLHLPDLAAPLTPETFTAMTCTARGVGFSPTLTYPSWEHPAVEALGLSDEEFDEYESFTDALYCGKPRHQLCGNPSTIQGEGMELICQLASSGYFCGSDWSHLGEVMPQMQDAAKRWHLVLQIDSDEELEFDWGDAGTVYFWAPADSQGKLQIHAAWVAMQCF